MVAFYLKELRSREKHAVECSEDEVSVASVKSIVADKLDIPIDEQSQRFSA